MLGAASEKVRFHYEKYPYPSYPLFAYGNWRQLQQVDLKKWGVEATCPNLWIAGCGTIAPLMFGRRNPKAQIYASDLSKRSLRIAKARCLLFGVHNISFKCGDLMSESFTEQFDAIDAYGVLHHTEKPEEAFVKLARALKPGGIIRLMLYSKEARREIENYRVEFARRGSLTFQEASREIPKELQKKYREIQNRSGFADALLHPVVHTFDQNELNKLIGSSPEMQLQEMSSKSNHVLFLRKASRS